MKTMQRRQVVLLTLAAGLWLILAVSTFVSGEYRDLPTWRAALKAVLGVLAIALLWEIWKPGGTGRR
jgi:hypothetical protein